MGNHALIYSKGGLWLPAASPDTHAFPLRTAARNLARELMARSTYSFEKRRREALKRAKKAEKAERKRARKDGKDPDELDPQATTESPGTAEPAKQTPQSSGPAPKSPAPKSTDEPNPPAKTA